MNTRAASPGTVAIFFDLDDTLLDDTGAQDAYLAELFVAWRTDLPHDEASFGDAWRTALDRHFERHLRGELTFLEQRRERIRDVFQAPRLSDEEADARTREFLESYEANWRLFDDVLPALDALAHLPLGVITNGLAPQQRAKLTRTGIAGRFAVMVTSDVSGLSKPDPRIFHEAAARLGAVRESCVHVGDDWARDVQGAVAAGFRPVWLDRGLPRQQRGDSPESVAHITSLLELVERL